MQIDCFLTSHHGLNKEREYFEELTIKSLQLNGFNPIIIRKKMLKRYFEAEKLAKSKIYIVCDNDVIFPTHDTLEKLVEIMRKNPKLSQLGLGWRKDMSPEANSSWRLGTVSDDVWEFASCGGCMAIRKGTIKDLGYKMEFENYGDDRVIGRIARELGYKVGIAHNLYFIHLGNEYSTFKDPNIT
jgi:GT2 family glycosyltransferase